MKYRFTTLFISLVLIFSNCSEDNNQVIIPQSRQIDFGSPQLVTVTGYTDDIMEPFLSRDGSILLFNNSNDPSVDTNIHYATRTNDVTFQYQGEVNSINSTELDAVASMDESNILYFVSTRSYDTTLSTIYSAAYSAGSVSSIQLVPNISKLQAGWLNFDVEVSKDSSTMFFVDGRFDAYGGPYEADIFIAEKIAGNFQRSADLSMVQYINTSALEYAACISSDMLELYFTRVAAPLTSESQPQIYVSTRNSTTDPFGMPYKIDAITGFVEAPTISADDQMIYYHKKESGIHMLYMVRKE